MNALLLALALGAATASNQGDLTRFENKWGWSGTGEAFVPQLVMYATPPNFYGNPGKVDKDVALFLDTFGFNGFHVFVSCRWFDIGEPDCREADGTDPELDPRTFEALAMLIEKTYAAGGMVHLWMWGDEERGQTPSARDDWGGLDGPVARKVEAAILERLGPLPGWSIGYGFDLDEWVEAEEIHAWRERMSRESPRPHFFGGRPQGPNNGKNHRRFSRWNQGLDYASYEHHKPSYTVYVEALEANPEKPVMSEDRFRVLNSSDRKHYTPQEIRRGLWHSTLAGGVANIWGYLLEGGSHELGSAPFPNRGQIRAHFEFLRGRFEKDMTRCSPKSASPNRNTLCLGNSRDQFLLYREDAERVDLDLREIAEPQLVVAVDAKKPYDEIPLGRYAPGRHRWTAPYRSDWALAVGVFERRAGAVPDATIAPEPLELSVLASEPGEVELRWSGASAPQLTVERAPGRGAAPGEFAAIGRVARSAGRFVDSEVREGDAYWYRLLDGSRFSESRRIFVGADATMVTDLRPQTYRIEPVAAGARYYVDRDYTLATFPAFLEGAQLVRTANDDKLDDREEAVGFTLSRPATLYVAFDRRAKRVPYWLDEWEPVDGRVSVEGDGMRYFELYRRGFASGPVSLGGNDAAGAEWGGDGQSQYIVLIVPESSR